MRIGMVIILILCAAPDTISCVRNLHIFLFSDGTVDTEIGHRVRNAERQRCRQGIIGVQAENRVRNQADSLTYLLKCMHDLTVPVKLIAEQVRHDNHLRMYPRNHLLEGALIAFNHCIVLFRSACRRRVRGKLRCDARKQICPGLIRKHLSAAARKRVIDHIRSRRLPVCSGHHNDFHVPGNRLQNITIYLHSQPARRRSTSTVHHPESRPRRLACPDSKHGF